MKCPICHKRIWRWQFVGVYLNDDPDNPDIAHDVCIVRQQLSTTGE